MNTPDIDIERLREAVSEYGNGLALSQTTFGRKAEWTLTIINAARFLVSLADQDGELWRFERCVHGHMDAHPVWDGPTKRAAWPSNAVIPTTHCHGGSRVRVWPKALTEGKN